MNNSKPKIFIVDDNHIFRSILRNILENSGEFILVGESSNGNECLTKIQNLDIDVILMDIKMPDLNGVKTTQVINYNNPDFPKIIAITQHDEFEYIKSMIEAGAKGYILKSEVAKQLKTAVEKVINGELYFPSLI
jgi:DNA-binding NarL/FixJ family response regulator